MDNIKDVKYNDTLNFYKSLEITNNPSLGICNLKPICEMLKYFPMTTIKISNNKSGCSSVENILSGCISNAHDKFSLSNEIEIFPNPTTGELNIGSIENIEKIKIYRMDGTLESYFENIKSRTININACSDGLKFVYIYNEGRSNPQIKKVIKIK